MNTLKIFGVTLITTLLILTVVSSALAQVSCAERDFVTKSLEEKYGETRLGAGMANEATVVFELWTSDETGSWSILKTTPDGMTCVMAVGEGWQDDVRMVPGQDS